MKRIKIISILMVVLAILYSCVEAPASQVPSEPKEHNFKEVETYVGNYLGSDNKEPNIHVYVDGKTGKRYLIATNYYGIFVKDL